MQYYVKTDQKIQFEKGIRGFTLVIYLDKTSVFDGIKIRRIKEGGTEYWIPDPQIYGKKGYYLPFELPIFYNPIMEVNRDLSIIAVGAYLELLGANPDDIVFVEALAGSGIRGFRLLNEVGPMAVIMNDINPLAYRFMHFNAKFFSEEIQAAIKLYNYDANFLLDYLSRSGKPDIVMIDPFGTPAPFIDAAIRALKKNRGLLLVTATDTAPLTGKFPNATLRKYGVNIFKTPFEKEVAVRVLITFLQKVAARYSVALVPVFGFFLNHFVKVGLLSFSGKKNADRVLKRHKYLVVKAFEYSVVENIINSDALIGPLWVDRIYDNEFLELMKKTLMRSPISGRNKEKLARYLDSELKTRNILFYYNVEHLASQLKKQTPKIADVINNLQEKGFIAERTHFDPKAVKTNAPLEIILEIIKKL